MIKTHLAPAKLLVRTIYFLIFLNLFLVPIFFFPIFLFPFVEPRTFLFLAITEITVLFYLFLILFDKSYRPQKNYIFYSFLLFFLFSVLSGILGPNIINSFWSNAARFDTLIVLSHVLMFFSVIAFTMRTKKVLHAFLWSSVVSAFVVTLSVYLSYLDLFKIFSFGFNITLNKSVSLGGLIGNESYTGAYLLFNLFFAVYLIFNTENKVKRYILEIILGTLLLSPIFFNFNIWKGEISFSDILNNPTLLLGSSRAVAISLGLSIFLIIILMFLQSVNKKVRFLGRGLTILFFSVFLVVFISIFIPGTKMGNWFLEQTGGYRYVFWHQSIEGFKDKPLLGWGPGNFYLVNEKYFDPSFSGSDYYAFSNMSDKAHNVIFDVLTTNGLVGLLIYLSIFFFAVMALWKSDRVPPLNKAILIGLIFAYFVQNLVFFDVLVTYIMLALLLAIIVYLTRESEASLVVSAPSKGRIFASGAIFFLLFLISIRFFVLNPIKEAYLSFNFYNLPPEVRAYYTGKRNFSLYGGSRIAESYAGSIFDWYLNNFSSIKENKNLDVYVKDLDNMINDIIDNSPNSEPTFIGSNTIFQLLDIKYQLTKDENLLPLMHLYSSKGIILSPNNVHSYVNKGRVFFYEKNYKESMAILEKALLLSPINPKLHVLLIDVARTSGDKKIMEEKIKRASEVLPGFIIK